MIGWRRLKQWNVLTCQRSNLHQRKINWSADSVRTFPSSTKISTSINIWLIFTSELNSTMIYLRWEKFVLRKNVLNSVIFQGSPFKCPVDGCPYESKVRHNLTVHYGVTHRKVFKFYNAVVGAGSDTDYMKHMTGSHAGRGGYGRRAGQGGANRRVATTMENCLVCEEQVSKETMVFHLAHKHFQDKVSHLPQTRPFKCPECPHINEFQVKFSSRLRLFFY